MHYHRLNRRFKCGSVTVRITGWSVTSRHGRPCSYRGNVRLSDGRKWSFDDLALGIQDYTNSVDTTLMLQRVAVAALGFAESSYEETGIEGQPPESWVEQFRWDADATLNQDTGETVYNVTL